MNQTACPNAAVCVTEPHQGAFIIPGKLVYQIWTRALKFLQHLKQDQHFFDVNHFLLLRLSLQWYFAISNWAPTKYLKMIILFIYVIALRILLLGLLNWHIVNWNIQTRLHAVYVTLLKTVLLNLCLIFEKILQAHCSSFNYTLLWVAMQ